MTTKTFSLGAGQSFPATLEFVDNFGNKGPAPAGFVPVWASDDNGTVLVVTPATDGLSANCVTVGLAGTANVTVTDTETALVLTGVLEVTVLAGAVSQLTVVPGTAV